MREILARLDSETVFFPVRHHSPTAAILLRDLIEEAKPSAVLIEGPSDYNEQISELALDHTLPIAIYSYFRKQNTTYGAFYPFTDFSPEYQAIIKCLQLKIPVQFIDLPFARLATRTRTKHQYADGPIRQSPAIEAVCEHFGVEDFDGLWDKLLESDTTLDIQTYMDRCHGICLLLRESCYIDEETTVREQFMVSKIHAVRSQYEGQLIIVTGGFHSAGLYELLKEPATALLSPDSPLLENEQPDSNEDIDSGATLTPFTDARLDAYKGYEAGLPCPGFYQQVWLGRLNGRLDSIHETLLAQAVQALRDAKQPISTADLIAARGMAEGLSQIRGHKAIFRNDLLDGICATMVKDETMFESVHPLMSELRSIFRGKRQGRLSARSSQPPLTIEIKAQLALLGLIPENSNEKKQLTLNLESTSDREISSFLHKLHTLTLRGFSRTGFSGFSGDESGKVQEDWTVWCSEYFEADCVEASVWGSNLQEAIINKLKASLEESGNKTELVAKVLTASCLMGLTEFSTELIESLRSTINVDQDFASVTKGMGEMFQLIHLDKLLKERPGNELYSLLSLTFERSLWLLESLGSTGDKGHLTGIWIISQVIQLLTETLKIDQSLVLESFQRARRQKDIAPLLAGGISGALYKLQNIGLESIRFDLAAFSAPDKVGDYLTGLFFLAEEILKLSPLLLEDLDNLIKVYTDEQYLEAVPALRIAFTKFTPREKTHILNELRKLRTAPESPRNLEPTTEIDEQLLYANIAAEAKVKEVLSIYGLRGLRDD
ncbi:MAG: hypothetical protein IPK73_10025 [Candidatus Obscuribacter sp.]|nr:hypothetical protein [Candidatus Obscuribacter sp.]